VFSILKAEFTIPKLSEVPRYGELLSLNSKKEETVHSSLIFGIHLAYISQVGLSRIPT